MREHGQPVGRAGQVLAWLGGAAFVASLGYFLYAYLVRFGRPAAQPMSVVTVTRPLLINLMLFTLFAAHHSVMARSGAKRWIARYIPETFERSFYVWIGSVLFV